jgi:hypothetical protein
MNPSDLTRKEQVFARLEAANGEWVDGPDLANAEVGGSEGLKRLREIRLDGYPIEMRKHPNPERDIWQYRLVREAEAALATMKPITEYEPGYPVKERLTFESIRICDRCDGKKWVMGFSSPRRRIECPRCEGKGVIKT